MPDISAKIITSTGKKTFPKINETIENNKKVLIPYTIVARIESLNSWLRTNLSITFATVHNNAASIDKITQSINYLE